MKKKPGGHSRKYAQSFLDGYFGHDPYKTHKKNPESKHTIKNDQWDREDYEAILEEMKELSVAEDKLTDKVDTGSSAMADMYFGLVKANPKLKDAKDVRPSYIVNRAVMGEAMDLKEYEDLRVSSTLDQVVSGLSCIAMEPELEILFDKLQEEQNMANQLQQMMQSMDGMSEDLESAEEMAAAAAAAGDDGKAENYQEQAEKIKEQMDKLREQMQAKADELDNGIAGKAPEMQEISKKAMHDAKQKADEMDGLSSTWGLDPGTLAAMPAARRIELAEKFNNEKFKRIAQLLGPMQRMALAEQMRKVNYARDEIYDVEQGNDLNVVLPTEMLMLGDPDMDVVFFNKYMERNLMQYKLRGTEKVAKGGIIWCEDGSGSMSGDPEVWAKAVGLSLYQIAKLQKRPFEAIHFGSVGEIMTFDFHTDQGDGVDIELYGKPYRVSSDDSGHYDNLDGVIKFAETFFGGGTDFVTPLSKALDMLKEQFEADGAVKGDIVFCTDGICGVPQDWLDDFKAEQERLGFRTWGILLGYHPSKSTEPLNTICDGKIFTLNDLLSGDGVRNIFKGV